MIALYFSVPAVSHNYAFTVAPSFIVTFLVANSTPIVGLVLLGNESFRNLLSKHVLPTDTSPIKITTGKLNK